MTKTVEDINAGILPLNDWGEYLNFSTWFMKKCIIWIEQDKTMK